MAMTQSQATPVHEGATIVESYPILPGNRVPSAADRSARRAGVARRGSRTLAEVQNARKSARPRVVGLTHYPAASEY